MDSLAAPISEYFFPNQSPQTLQLEGRFRHEAAKLPQESPLVLHELRSQAREPEPRNVACVARNLAPSRGARATNAGLYCETKLASLNISASSVEHSMLRPDDGPPVAVMEIQVIALTDYCRMHGVDRLDF